MTSISVASRIVAATTLAAAITSQPPPAFIYAAAADRAGYLARAVIWKDSGPPTPEAIMAGPRASAADAIVNAPADQPIECHFERSGIGMGGKTRKFTCRTTDGQLLRIKYFDGSEKGNREVFAEVAATRLLWALGFDADAVYQRVVTCLDCPEDPFTGKGGRQSRRYIAAYEPHYSGTTITSTKDPDQGWTFGELETAIDSLPPGELRNRQREQFDALSLLAVFIQHGDRKRSQQRVTCRGDIDFTHGEMRDVLPEEGSVPVPVLFERPGGPVCPGDTMVTLQDVGATFGGAGRLTRPETAKVNLASWAAERIFTDERAAGAAIECHGRIAVSGAAGGEARANPRIGEAGREFLLQQLQRLTPDHVRAIFTAAHIDRLGTTPAWRDPSSGRQYTGIDAWVAVFVDKVRQIDAQRCTP